MLVENQFQALKLPLSQKTPNELNIDKRLIDYLISVILFKESSSSSTTKGPDEPPDELIHGLMLCNTMVNYW